MATISFVIRGDVSTTQQANAINLTATAQRAKLKQVGPDSPGLQFIFPYGPQTVRYGEVGLDYDVTKRPGSKGQLTAVNNKLRTVEVSALIADKISSGKFSVEGRLNAFIKMAESPHDCAFTYGVVTLPFRVRITSVDYSSIRRDLDGNITQAEVNFTLTEKVEFSQSIVTLSAITYDPPAVPSTSTKTPGKKPSPPGKGTGLPPTLYVPRDVNAVSSNRGFVG